MHITESDLCKNRGSTPACVVACSTCAQMDNRTGKTETFSFLQTLTGRSQKQLNVCPYLRTFKSEEVQALLDSVVERTSGFPIGVEMVHTFS